jgi:hypothetical protein
VLPLRSVLILVGALAVLGCGSTQGPDPNYKPPPDYRAWSLQLKEQMTEDDVLHAIGVPPSKVELKTCGQNLGKPWQCKSWTYGHVMNNLTVYFQKSSDDLWRVSSWRVT